MEVERINPYRNGGDKTEQVERMFDSIAPAYDFMNSAMSFGQNHKWRNKALKDAIASLKSDTDISILDVATGTGDVAFRLNRLMPRALITGIDLSEGMLGVAREKLAKLPTGRQEKLAFGKADSLSLPYHDSTFDMITVAYGVRNFSNLSKGLKEMKRVLKHDGIVCIIELSCPTGKIISSLYKFYSGKLIPWAGKLVSGDHRAYKYLPESIEACPQRDEMSSLLYEAGFSSVRWKSLSFGAVTYYIAS